MYGPSTYITYNLLASIVNHTYVTDYSRCPLLHDVRLVPSSYKALRWLSFPVPDSFARQSLIFIGRRRERERERSSASELWPRWIRTRRWKEMLGLRAYMCSTAQLSSDNHIKSFPNPSLSLSLSSSSLELWMLQPKPDILFLVPLAKPSRKPQQAGREK